MLRAAVCTAEQQKREWTRRNRVMKVNGSEQTQPQYETLVSFSVRTDVGR